MKVKMPDSFFDYKSKYSMPKVICLDIDSSCVNEIEKKYEVFYGSFWSDRDSYNNNGIYIPDNYIDYDVLVLDVKDFDYIVKKINYNSYSVVNWFLKLFEDDQRNQKLEIIFCASLNSLIGNNSQEIKKYDFLCEICRVTNRHSKVHSFMSDCCWLSKFEQEFTSSICFDIYSDRGFSFPLLENRTGDITGFLWTNGNLVRVILPQIKYQRKAELVFDIISNIGLVYCSKIFPEQVRQDWFVDSYYPLPVQRLLMNKRNVIEESKNKLESIDEQIICEKEKYFFLKNLLVSDGDTLVESVVEALSVIGIDNIVDVDKVKSPSEIFEEDLRIEDYHGYRLVIEVKGITAQIPTDEDCRQIGKVVLRYLHDREDNKDTHGILILNHQKNQALEQRTSNPFIGEKEKDAIIEMRGLMTTAFLYNICKSVLNGTLNKSLIGNFLLQNGVIDSLASDSESVGVVDEYYKNPNACVVTCLKKTIQVGDELLLNHGANWVSGTITSLQNNDIPVRSVKEGQTAGIVFNTDFKPEKGTVLYLKKETV